MKAREPEKRDSRKSAPEKTRRTEISRTDRKTDRRDVSGWLGWLCWRGWLGWLGCLSAYCWLGCRSTIAGLAGLLMGVGERSRAVLGGLVYFISTYSTLTPGVSVGLVTVQVKIVKGSSR